ncbi:hypothetical protein DPMN_156542 [Dreissena polymorpha]|uniref:Uncharacterized protein n=1 Tax=Dreissena polymorpha TaxID=45954 RepID=A0A9D4JAX9_DREPO|nr:hypothetical protein DPMN_156542 [Dreissena polymorpha]
MIGKFYGATEGNCNISPAEVAGHQKLYSMTDSETALNTRPVVSRGSVSLERILLEQVLTLQLARLVAPKSLSAPMKRPDALEMGTTDT